VIFTNERVRILSNKRDLVEFSALLHYNLGRACYVAMGAVNHCNLLPKVTDFCFCYPQLAVQMLISFYRRQQVGPLDILINCFQLSKPF